MSFAKAICSGSGVDVPDEVVCKESAASGSPSDSDSASETSDDNDPEETGDSDNEEEADGAGARAIPVVGGIAGGVFAAMALL